MHGNARRDINSNVVSVRASIVERSTPPRDTTRRRTIFSCRQLMCRTQFVEAACDVAEKPGAERIAMQECAPTGGRSLFASIVMTTSCSSDPSGLHILYQCRAAAAGTEIVYVDLLKFLACTFRNEIL